MTPFQPLSDESAPPPHSARRRRARSLLPFFGREEQDQALDDLAQRALPRLEFFLLTLLSAFLFSLAYVFSSPILLVVGLALSPPLRPLTGTALGLATASARFALRNLAALALSWILAFAAAWSAAYLFSFLPGSGVLPSQLDLLSVLIVALASAFLTWRFIRGVSDSWIPNAIVSFGCWYPVCVAAWAMVEGNGGEAQAALLAWGIRSILALQVSIGVYLANGFRPAERNARGYLGIAAAGIAGIALLAAWIGVPQPPAQTAPTTPAPILLATTSPTRTAVPTITQTPTVTPTNTGTPVPSATFTLTPLPVSAVVQGTGGSGVFVRDAPGMDGEKIASLQEGDVVQVIGSPVEKDGTLWIPIRISGGQTGWMALEYCATMTPTRTPQ
jgi:hypothetical protein